MLVVMLLPEAMLGALRRSVCELVCFGPHASERYNGAPPYIVVRAR